MIVTAIFNLEGEIFSGRITSFQGNTMLPFTEVIVTDGNIEAKFDLSTVEGVKNVTILFILSGDSLQGTGELTIGEKTTALNYDLKRLPQMELEYDSILSERNPTTKKQLIDEFVARYPDSEYTAYAYEQGVWLGRQTNNLEMMGSYGEKSLALWPDNFVLLTELGNTYVQSKKLDQAETKALQALELIDKAAKPEQTTDQQWEQGKKAARATNFSTIGYVHLYRSMADAAQEAKRREAQQALAPFKKALDFNPSDDFSFYGLGLSYATLNDYTNAESCLAKAVALNGPVMNNATATLQEIYKRRHNNSLEGLDKVIAKAKAELGIP
jgi:tetratricopeptide (TPR) repeat protein